MEFDDDDDDACKAVDNIDDDGVVVNFDVTLSVALVPQSFFFVHMVG